MEHQAHERPTIAFIGRVTPIKDVQTFIDVAERLLGQFPNLEALVIGPMDEDPEYAQACIAEVNRRHLTNTVRFTGPVKVLDHLGSIDVVVLTSISEAQPIALLEAAATGLPAVTTDVGSCREIIEGFAEDPVVGRGGIVVEACNPRAVAEALATILLDAELRAEMGQVMQRRIPQLYHKARIKRLYDELYAELPAARPSASPNAQPDRAATRMPRPGMPHAASAAAHGGG